MTPGALDGPPGRSIAYRSTAYRSSAHVIDRRDGYYLPIVFILLSFDAFIL